MVGGIQQGTDRATLALCRAAIAGHATLDVAKAAGRALDEITSYLADQRRRNLVIASAAKGRPRWPAE
jgi:hypothetical protein